MADWFLALPHTVQALLATLFTWGVTALGAGLVFFFRTMNKNALDAMLGFAAGVMTAASFWSLLSPAIELAGTLGMNVWATALLGFLGGGALLYLGDRLWERMERRSGAAGASSRPPGADADEQHNAAQHTGGASPWAWPSAPWPTGWTARRRGGLPAGAGHRHTEPAGGHGGERPAPARGHEPGPGPFSSARPAASSSPSRAS